MATTQYRIVAGTDSDIHDEPHLPESRLTVREIHAHVNERDLRPETIADRFNLDIADVYEALAYYHSNPEEMRAAEQRYERANAVASERSSMTPPNDA